MDKKSIREQTKLLKKELTYSEIAEKSRVIIGRLTELEEYKSESAVYTYVSYNQEVETRNFIQQALDDGKTVYVPKIHESNMEDSQKEKVMLFHRISSLDELVSGGMGILEPDNHVIDSTKKGLLILPGLAFDKQYHRIGYGGGFYDRYLSAHNQHIKIALCFDFQIFDHIETEEYDIKADRIITEKHIY